MDQGVPLVSRPVLFKFDAKNCVMVVNPRWREIARRMFKDGEDYALEEKLERSSAQHKFYFVSIKNAFTNLNKETLDLLKTPNHLRQWALITTGWYDERQVGGLSLAQAKRMAVIVAALLRSNTDDDYVEIIVRRNRDESDRLDGTANLIVRTPKSQSRDAMDRETFKKSCEDVLDVLAGAINVTRRELEDSGKTTI